MTSTTTLRLTYLGTFWQASGDLLYLVHPDGTQARIFVDSLGETWVDIRRIPEGRYFYTERVDAYRALNGAAKAERELLDRGYGRQCVAYGAQRVREREGYGV